MKLNDSFTKLTAAHLGRVGIYTENDLFRFLQGVREGQDPLEVLKKEILEKDPSSHHRIRKVMVEISDVLFVHSFHSDLGEKLFGRVAKIRATGSHVPTKQRLLEPLEWPAAVAHMFCRGCGFYSEVNTLTAHDLLLRCGQTGTELRDKFFEVGGCDACDGDDHTITLRNISDVTD